MLFHHDYLAKLSHKEIHVGWYMDPSIVILIFPERDVIESCRVNFFLSLFEFFLLQDFVMISFRSLLEVRVVIGMFPEFFKLMGLRKTTLFRFCKVEVNLLDCPISFMLNFNWYVTCFTINHAKKGGSNGDLISGA